MKTIKFLSLLMFIALSAGFASCSDDDDDNEPTVVGTWQATYVEGWAKFADYPKDNREWEGTWTEQAKNSDSFKMIVFNEDKTGYFNIDQEDMVDDEKTVEVKVNFTWSYENKVLKFVFDKQYDPEEGEDSSSEEIKLVDLTATTAIFEMTASYPLEGGYTSYEKVTFTRVK